MTQPAATIIASCIAIGAALIAFFGVIVNAWVTSRQHRQRLDAERRARDRDEKIAAARRRRDEAIGEVTAATEVAMRAWTLIGAAHNELWDIYDATPWTPGEAQTALEDCATAEMRLAVFGLDQARDACKSYAEVMRRLWEETIQDVDGGPSFKSGHDAMAALRTAFRQTVADLDAEVTAAAVGNEIAGADR
ncbi:hypothetical protein K8O93_08400 [Gordonia bronchialis]|uniref:hypothetical protein n=1 Tax=Gordonia bronchialis TaxID=2054 RepID=UPI001CBCEAB5|nr:hypothetical protein [Gordonia bronchialis]UAK39656.1 hypothetical protein K8O93_08400 [Gordonia bronchialis]